MKELIFVWGCDDHTFLGCFKTLDDAQEWVLVSKTLEDYPYVEYIRCQVGVSYQDTSEYLFKQSSGD